MLGQHQGMACACRKLSRWFVRLQLWGDLYFEAFKADKEEEQRKASHLCGSGHATLFQQVKSTVIEEEDLLFKIWCLCLVELTAFCWKQAKQAAAAARRDEGGWDGGEGAWGEGWCLDVLAHLRSVHYKCAFPCGS